MVQYDNNKFIFLFVFSFIEEHFFISHVKIVSHIAITVTDMAKLKKKLKKLNVESRRNISVPNPVDNETGILDQVTLYRIHMKFMAVIYGLGIPDLTCD